jgi:hypothetical protein
MRSILFAVAMLLAACNPVQMRSEINRPVGEPYASAGDIVVRVERTDDLPNVFGRADLFGRTRDRGFTEVRYMGVNAAGAPLFRRRDVDIMTNETTMSRTGGFSSFQAPGGARRVGSVGSAGFSAAGSSYTPPMANVGALPPDTTEFALDLKQGRVVTVGQHGFEVVEAMPAGVKFRAY